MDGRVERVDGGGVNSRVERVDRVEGMDNCVESVGILD